jgi:hypothetical protein
MIKQYEKPATLERAIAIAADPVAMAVKLTDLEDNLDARLSR